jgi:hypothetical protein
MANVARSAMRRPLRFLFVLLASASVALAVAAPAAAQKADPAPKPETYLCPHAEGTRIDCYLDAIDHLYTMCRNVKSIEIIEFGYDKAEDGVNSAKTEYCIDKHGHSLMGPLQAALREAGKNRAVVEALNSLHDYWVQSLAELKWHRGETDEQYKARTSQPYGIFRERAMLVRAALTEPAPKAASTAATSKTKAKTAAAAPAAPKSPN